MFSYHVRVVPRAGVERSTLDGLEGARRRGGARGGQAGQCAVVHKLQGLPPAWEVAARGQLPRTGARLKSWTSRGDRVAAGVRGTRRARGAAGRRRWRGAPRGETQTVHMQHDTHTKLIRRSIPFFTLESLREVRVQSACRVDCRVQSR